MSHQSPVSGEFWVRRFRMQAETVVQRVSGDCETRTRSRLRTTGLTHTEHWVWLEAHRLLFGRLSLHLLGWPRSLEQKLVLGWQMTQGTGTTTK